MPEAVRAVITSARAGEGPAAVWLSRTGPGYGQIGDCLGLLANKPKLDPEIVGWLVGITMFGDERQRLAAVLKRRSHRDNVIAHVIEAFVAGLRAGMATSGRQWVSIEMLVGRIVEVPPSLVDVLPVGICAKHALSRGCALRLAQRLGTPARQAIEAARGGATRSDERKLDEVLATLSGSAAARRTNAEDVDLLGRLLEAWRDTHDPELEGPIARLGVEIGRARGELVARSKGELEGAWLALAASKDPADVSRLLDAPWPGAWKAALVRVDLLGEFPPDPRISAHVAEAARTYESKGSYPFHVEISKLLFRAPTASILASLDAIEAARASPTTKTIYLRVRRAIDALDTTRADPELLAEAHQRERGTADLAALFAAHATNPTDLASRAVLADALQVAGDPRGELITLQLALAAGTADVKAARRVAALLAAHADAWTGPLPGVDRASRRFERGFLVALRSSAEPEVLARSLDRPEWVTVEEVTFTNPNCDLAPLVRRMPLLRRLAATPNALTRLVEAGPIRAIRAVFCQQGFVPPVGAFPDLVILGGNWFMNDWNAERFRTVQRAAAELGVQAIVHTGFPREHLPFAVKECASGPPETRFAFDRWAPGFDAVGWRVRVRRDRSVVDLACGNSAYHVRFADELFEALVAAGRTSIALYLAEDIRAEYGPRFEHGRRGIELLPGQPIDLAAPA